MVIFRVVFLSLLSGFSVLGYSQKADSLKELLYNANSDSVSLALNQEIGNLFYRSSEYDTAAYFYEVAYELAIKTNNKHKQSGLASLRGTMMYWNSFHEVADTLFKQSLQLAIELNDSGLITRAYNSLSSNNLALEDTLKAEQCIKKALAFCPNQDKVLKGRTFANLGQLKRGQGDLNGALRNFQLSENMWIELKNDQNISRIQFERAKIYYLQQKYQKSIAYLYRSLELDSVDTNKTLETWKYQRMSDAYRELGRYDSAYRYQRLHTDTYQAIFYLRKSEVIKDLNLKYETERKDHENSILKNKTELQQKTINNRNIISIISLVALVSILIALIVAIRGRKKLEKANTDLNEQKEEMLVQADNLKMANDKLKELDEFKGDVSQMLVHDLKSPLNTLLNLPESFTPNEKEEMITYSAQKMLNLVLNILDVTKYKDVELLLTPETNLVETLWSKVVFQQSYDIKQKGINVTSNFPDGFSVLSDKELTERIFSNILSNAIKYTPDNGEIGVNILGEANGFTKISITDNGVGIAADQLDTVFGKYSQDSTKISYSTGLGLTFCKMVIEKHGGAISIKSKENEGTTVCITLPSAKANVPVLNDEAEKQTEILLSQEEKELLMQYMVKLEFMDLSEITAFRKVFKKIERIGLVNEQWLSTLKNAAYRGNKKQYDVLIRMVK